MAGLSQTTEVCVAHGPMSNEVSVAVIVDLLNLTRKSFSAGVPGLSK
jgi:hypothetical protein